MSAANPNLIPQPVTKTEGFNYGALIARLLVAIVLAGSLWLIWWSYYRVFFPHFKESRELTQTVSKLTTEVDQLKNMWSTKDIEEIDKKTGMVQTNLFADQAQLHAWLANLRDQAMAMGVDLKADFARSLEQTDAEPRFLIFPTKLSVQFQPVPGPAKGPSPYLRLLQLTQLLTAEEKADCLNELTAESGPRSIDHAVMGFNFWTGTNDSK